MQLGFTSMNTPDDIGAAQLARDLEERGYGSLFIGEHSHIPVSRKTPYPAGGTMPEQYKHMMDPFVGLTLAAAATTKLEIGLGVCLPLEHHLLTLSKAVASLDIASDGRLLFGVGVGWNAEELANHRPDIAWSQRYRATAEAVAALKACWVEDEAEFHGNYFDFEPLWSYPKPVQNPHPPVLLGASGKLGIANAVEWADEWMPVDAAIGAPNNEIVRKVVSRVTAAAQEVGKTLPVTIVTFGDPSPDSLRFYAEMGVRRTVIGASRTDWGDPRSTMPFIEKYAVLIPELSD